MTILLIDTAFDTCQVGLWRDGTLVASKALPGEARHDVVLAPLVAGLLDDHHLSVSDLTAVAAITGPGRFTSLRVGIAFARALVLPHRIPLVGIATGAVLQDLASAWLVMVKRGEVFAQSKAQAEPLNLTFADLPGWLDTVSPDRLAVIGAGIPTEWGIHIPASVSYNIVPHLPLDRMGQVAAHDLLNGHQAGQPVRPYYGSSTGAWDMRRPD